MCDPNVCEVFVENNFQVMIEFEHANIRVT